MTASLFANLLPNHPKTAVTAVTPVTALKNKADFGNRTFDPAVTMVTALKNKETQLSETLTDALLDEFEERAAILEYDAGLSRADAERIAYVAVYGLAARSRRRWR